MQADAVTTLTLAGRTVLVSPNERHAELATELERCGARVLTWPRLDVRHLENQAALDEAIDNLFGYDWLIFRNIHAVDFFLHRFRDLGGDISELDALRVCAIGETTRALLENSQVHVDVIPDRLSSAAALSAIAGYAGGRDSLGGLNFLIPRAAIATDSLARSLEELGARVDEVTTYLTCSPDNPDLAQIKGLLKGGGIDCIAFASSPDLRDFAAVFDTIDIEGLVDGVAVACMDENTAQLAAKFGVHLDLRPSDATIAALSQTVSEYLCVIGQ